MSPPLRLALEVWGNDAGRIITVAQAAEELGFNALYYGESPNSLNLETWTILATLAARTTTLRVGPVIATLLPGYRSFPLFARQVHALALVSGGRLDIRTGTGAATAWARPWWGPAGVDYPDRSTRRRVLEEWLRALHHVWDQPGKAFSGREVWFDALPLEPAVDRPPITVAAMGPAAMRIAADYADVWEASHLTPGEFRDLAARFGDVAGRNRPRIARSVEVDAVTGATAAERARLTERFLHERGAEGRAALAKALTGPASHVAEQLYAYRAAGVDQVLIAAVDPYATSTLETLAEAAAML